jgi:hypothetical protein
MRRNRWLGRLAQGRRSAIRVAVEIERNTKSRESRAWSGGSVTAVACVLGACYGDGAAEPLAVVVQESGASVWGACE